MRLFRQRSRSATVGRHFPNLVIRQKRTTSNVKEDRILQILPYLADTKIFVM